MNSWSAVGWEGPESSSRSPPAMGRAVLWTLAEWLQLEGPPHHGCPKSHHQMLPKNPCAGGMGDTGGMQDWVCSALSQGVREGNSQSLHRTQGRLWAVTAALCVFRGL